MLTVGSLFSGIGGIDLGLERAGAEIRWMCERDNYAQKVLLKNFKGVPLYGDVREIHSPSVCNARVFSDTCPLCLPYVDVLAGGFPCQDISVAGKGKGIEKGERSGLWREFARLVRELRPRYVLVENVPALRSRGLDRVLGDLAACGYDAEWDCFPASAFGAPHRRDRIFVVAYAKREQLWEQSGRGSGQDRTDTVFPPVDGQEGHVANSIGEPGESRGPSDAEQSARGRHLGRGGEREDVADSDGQGELQQGGAFLEERGRARDGSREGGPGWWAVEPDVGRVASGVSARVDRLRCLGNAVVPQVAEYVGRLIVAHAEQGGGR